MAKSNKKATNKNGTAIYVGPNMGGETPMSQFTVFKNGLPAHIAARADVDPNFKRLFVPVETLNAAREGLKNPASAIARAFKTILNERGVK